MTQASPLRRKRAFDFYGDGMGEVLTEDGRALRPKDAKCREFRKRRLGRKPKKARR